MAWSRAINWRSGRPLPAAEPLGEEVAVVAGDPMAFKVTTPLDLALAQVLAARP